MTSSFGRAFTLSPTRPDNNILPFSSLKRSVVEAVAINWEETSLRVYNALGLATLRQCKSTTHNTTLLEIDDGKRGEIKVVGRLGISSRAVAGAIQRRKEKMIDFLFILSQNGLKTWLKVIWVLLAAVWWRRKKCKSSDKEPCNELSHFAGNKTKF